MERRLRFGFVFSDLVFIDRAQLSATIGRLPKGEYRHYIEMGSTERPKRYEYSFIQIVAVSHGILRRSGTHTG